MISPSGTGGDSDILFVQSCYSYSTIEVTPTPTPIPTNKEASNGQRHKCQVYIFVSMDIMSYSIHIQFFSQNQFLLSLIQNQISKRERHKNKKNTKTKRTMMMMMMMQQLQQQR